MAPRNSKTNAHITRWFNTGDPSPIEIVDNVVQTFSQDVQHAGHCLCVTENQLFAIMCQAVCVYYHAYLRNEDVQGPKRTFPKPLKWSDSLETAWTDYIHSRVFPYTYWERFWGLCDAEYFDSVYGLTTFLETVLPLYIARDIQCLLDNELVVENTDGIVPWEEYESHEDD